MRCLITIAVAGLMLAGCGGAETWDYVALGDSMTRHASWPEEYAAHIEEDLGVTVEVHNHGRSRALDAKVLEMLRGDDDLRALVGEAEVITLNGGAMALQFQTVPYILGDCRGEDNQDCLRELVEEFKTNWDAILDEIAALRTPSEALVRVLPMWVWILDGHRDNPDEWETLLAYAMEMNEHAVKAAEERGIAVADVHSAFNGPDGHNPAPEGVISTDNIHLSDDGNTAVADLLREVGYEYAGEGA